jgi:hypothetical protein
MYFGLGDHWASQFRTNRTLQHLKEFSRPIAPLPTLLPIALIEDRGRRHAIEKLSAKVVPGEKRGGHIYPSFLES